MTYTSVCKCNGYNIEFCSIISTSCVFFIYVRFSTSIRKTIFVTPSKTALKIWWPIKSVLSLWTSWNIEDEPDALICMQISSNSILTSCTWESRYWKIWVMQNMLTSNRLFIVRMFLASVYGHGDDSYMTN